MNHREKTFFRIAEEASHLSNFDRVSIGCVIAKKNEIISVGNNSSKTHPMQKKWNKKRKQYAYLSHFIHAEMDAMRKAKKITDFSKCEMFIFRKDKNGKLALSRPCPACMAKIQKMGIKKIHYTTNNGFCVEEFSKGV